MKTTVTYLLKKLKFPELCEFITADNYRYISFTIGKNLKYTPENAPYVEIIITYRLGDKVHKHYTYFYSNGRYICFETLDAEKENYYGSFSKTSSWFFLPKWLQSYKLGSLLLYECIAFRDEFYPSLKLTPLTLSYDKNTNPKNEIRRNKLYENFGYTIKDYKAVHSNTISTIIDSKFGYTITAIENHDGKIEELLDDLQN